MTGSPPFCQHPGDPEGCEKGLVAAWKQVRLAEHCVVEGLRQDRQPCRDVLVKGLYDGSPQGEGEDRSAESPLSGREASRAACQTVVLLGYEQDLPGAKHAFVQAYHRLVRCIIGKFGLAESSIPSADDVYQDVFLGLHKHLCKGASIDAGMLGAYVRQATVHACFRARRAESVRPETLEEVAAGAGQWVWPRGTVQKPAMEPPDIEAWEQLDWQLSRSDQGDLINRIILAHKCVGGQRGGKKLPVKEMMADWRHLAGRPEDELKRLHDTVAATSGGQVWTGIPVLAAYLINGRLAQPWQVPVVFASATDMDVGETQALLQRLVELSEEAVYARISRLKAALAPSSGGVGGGEQPAGE